MITREQYNSIQPGDILVIRPKVNIRKRKVLDFFPETGLAMLQNVGNEGFTYVKFHDVAHRIKSIIPSNSPKTVTEWLTILQERGDRILDYGRDYIQYKHKATGKLKLIELKES